MKMPGKIKVMMFAPCGMNCKVCYKHCFNKKLCAGCMESGSGKPEHCRKCRIKDCVRSKNIKYCFECSDFPCKHIKRLEKSYNGRYQTSPVSYTHLDVYKRQALILPGMKMFRGRIWNHTCLFFRKVPAGLHRNRGRMSVLSATTG